MDNNKEYLYIDYSKHENSDNSYQSQFKVSKASKIDYLINEKEYDRALSEIDKLLQKDDSNYEYLHLKAIILDKLSEYEKAVEYYNGALNYNSSDEITSNKANTLYKWAKITYFPEMNYEKALDLVNESLKIIPDDEDASEHYFLKGEILEALMRPVEAKKSYLIAYKEFDKLEELEKQVEFLNTSKDTLINITGTNFYDFTAEKDLTVNLIREEDNEHDSDAIAIEFDGKKVGYVANSSYTLIDEVKSASDIKNLIKQNQKARILFIYLDEYIIAKLI